MYSGSTLTNASGRLLGAHQKIDRVARRNLTKLLPSSNMPSISRILHFEGGNGPDAMKRKSPSKDEPWHFIQPFDDQDTQLIDSIKQHHSQLVKTLKDHDEVRAAFEAAWLAHAMVDGLTPAHHYPYEEKLLELRSGQNRDTRLLLRDRFIISGGKPSNQLKNNWKMWGPKGLLTTHAAFEGGVATVIAPLSLRESLPNKEELSELSNMDFGLWYRKQAQKVADWHLYDDFYISGWTTKLARQIRDQLAPLLVRTVTAAWYVAAIAAVGNSSEKDH